MRAKGRNGNYELKFIEMKKLNWGTWLCIITAVLSIIGMCICDCVDINMEGMFALTTLASIFGIIASMMEAEGY